MTEDQPAPIDDLTAFEVAQAERTAGMSMATLADQMVPKMPLVGALGWVLTKRGEPTLTYDAYMKRHKSHEIQEHVFGTDADDEPAEGGDPFREATEVGAGDGEGRVLPAYRDPAE